MNYDTSNIKDYKEEIISWINMHNSNNMDYLILYWLSDGDIDLDVSKNVVEKYKRAYPYLQDSTIKLAFESTNSISTYNPLHFKYELVCEKATPSIIYSGDTATSARLILSRAIKLYCDNTWNIKSSKKRLIRKLVDHPEYWSKTEGICFPQFVKDFIVLSHSFGNFMPIPLFVNKARAGKNGYHDFIDLFLFSIHKWYENNKNINENFDSSSLEDLFSHYINKSKAIEKCTKWLQSLDNWDSFVEKNYFQPFVENNSDNNSNKYGSPILLWNNHSLDNLGLPNNPDIFENFLYKLNFSICERNKLLEKALNS